MGEAENWTLDESENQTMDGTENRIIHSTIRTLADLERFTTIYHDNPINNETCIRYKTYDHSSNVTNTFDQ